MALQIKLLDALQIKQDGRPLPVTHSPKGLALLSYLLVTRKAHHREFLADLLWDAPSTAQALGNLRALLFRLRKSIPQIQSEGDWLAFSAHPEDEIDLYTLDAGLAASDLAVLDQALRSYRSDLLRDYYLPDAPRFNEWLTIEREYLRQRVVQAYARLCQAYQEQGSWNPGAAAAQRWLELDYLDEDAYYWRVFFLAASGQNHMAVGEYQRYCQVISEQFSLKPAPRMTALFEQINAAKTAETQHAPNMAHPQPKRPAFPPDWGEAPVLGAFFGRSEELTQLENWLLGEECQVVTILGMGGQGKTTLAAWAARTWVEQFDGVFWRSLLNAPLPGELLGDLLVYLSGDPMANLPTAMNARLAALEKYLKAGRFLIILDNLESVMLDETAGVFDAAYTEYGRLLQVFSSSIHQSKLLLTSRETPQYLERLARDAARVRSLPLTGLLMKHGAELLQHAGASGSALEIEQLVQRYSGNPLAIKLIIQVVQDFYSGSISAFLQNETAIFEDIRFVLDQQFARLSALEKEILLWLAIEREPTQLTEIKNHLLQPPPQRHLLEAIYNLQRRSLVEKHPHGISLQNVIIEYLTDHLIEHITREIIRGNRLYYLAHFALQPAQGREHVRLSQRRRVIQPVLDLLAAKLEPGKLATHIKSWLEQLRELKTQQQGYAGGNLLNLLLSSGLPPAEFNFSGLNIWQVNLQGVDLQNVDFSEADFSGSIFTDRFGLIYATAYSPNGKLLAAGSGDGRLQLWSAVNNQPLFTIQAHSQSIWGIAFSPDGETLASCGADSSIRFWDIRSSAAGMVLHGQTEGILAVAFSPDGQTLASAAGDGSVFLWDAHTGQVQHMLKAHRANVQTIAFSPDGAWLASSGRDETVFLWQVRRLSNLIVKQPSLALQGHSGWVNTLAFHPDSHTLASAGNDTIIRLWNVQTGEQEQEIRGHTAGIHALAFSPNGQILASGGHDHSVRLWDWRTGDIRHTFWGHTNWVYSLAFSPDGHTLASGSWDHSVRLWDVRQQYALHTYHGSMRWAFGLAFSPDGRTLASATADKKVRLWDVGRGEIYQTFIGHRDWVWNVAFTPDGAALASISMDHTLRLWDVRTSALLSILKGHQDGLQALAISPNGRLLATGGLDHSILLWDIQSVRQTQQAAFVGRITGHTGWCLGLAFSPDSAFLASSSADHTVRLWDIGSKSCIMSFTGHEDGVQQVLFSPDGRTLASAGWDTMALIWDVQTGSIIQRLKGHTGVLRALAFSPDGQTLATGGNDQVIRLWDLSNGALRHELPGHTNWVFYLAFSPDGRVLASASGDETIKLWDAARGEIQANWPIPGPYESMNLRGVRGLSASQLSNLKALGAIEEAPFST